ncbi:MAG: hypothetical protein RLZZ563_2540 [Pseudomonadota bacterium]
MSAPPRKTPPSTRSPSAWSFLRQQSRNWNAIATLAIFGLILGLAGPFGTISFVPLPGRLFYWMALTFLLAPLGTFLSMALTDWCFARGLPRLVAAPLGGLIAGPILTFVIFSYNHLTIGRPLPPPNAVALAISFAVITAALNTSLALAFRPLPALPQTPPPAADAQPRLMQRLRQDLRAPILSLRATDHYTEVTTEHGSQTLLLRLADAILEAAPTDGLQVHRSHWVSRKHIAALRRDKGRVILTLTDGRDIPVSRTYEQAAKEAGPPSAI